MAEAKGDPIGPLNRDPRTRDYTHVRGSYPDRTRYARSRIDEIDPDHLYSKIPRDPSRAFSVFPPRFGLWREERGFRDFEMLGFDGFLILGVLLAGIGILFDIVT